MQILISSFLQIVDLWKVCVCVTFPIFIMSKYYFCNRGKDP